jgi:hypothetical protein
MSHWKTVWKRKIWYETGKGRLQEDGTDWRNLIHLHMQTINDSRWRRIFMA